jgi:hypothetical protein
MSESVVLKPSNDAYLRLAAPVEKPAEPSINDIDMIANEVVHRMETDTTIASERYKIKTAARMAARLALGIESEGDA